mgnify:CR=1 FL=1
MHNGTSRLAVQGKVRTAIASMKYTRSMHKSVATSYADELCGKRRELLVAEDRRVEPASEGRGGLGGGRSETHTPQT